MSTISKDTPLSEITLRRYEKPSVKGRELVRKMCLSLGVLQPGDSRDVIVDVFDVLVKASKEKKMLSADEIENEVVKNRKSLKLPLKGVASSNIRRQIRRLRDIMVVEKVKTTYRISEFSGLKELFEEKVMKYYVDSIQERIYEYCEALDND